MEFRKFDVQTARVVFRLALVLSLIVGTFSAVKFVTAHASSRSVYNLEIDTAAYDEIAQRLAVDRDVRAIPPSQPPGFVVLLAVIYALFGHSYLAAKLVFCGFLMGAALLAVLIGWTRLGSLEGLVAGALTVWSPLLVSYAATLQYEVPALFLSMLVTTLVVVPGTSNRPAIEFARAMATGLVCAAAALLREPLAVLLPIAVVASWQRNTHVHTRRRAAQAIAVTLLMFALPIVGWGWTQQRHFGRFVVLSNKSDVNLRIGNNPAADGTYGLQLRPVAEPSGILFIRTEPVAALRLAGRKCLYFWGILRDPWTVPHTSAALLSRLLLNRPPYEVILSAARGGIPLILFTAGLVRLRRRSGIWPVPAAVLAVMSVHVLYFASNRFAVPVYGQIYVVTGAALAGLFTRIAETGRTAFAASVVFAVWVLFAQSRWLPGTYHAEAESLEGISADNTVDSLADNGVSRFASAANGPRPVAFLSDEAFPRGAFTVRVRARLTQCADPSIPALVIAIRGADSAAAARDRFTVGDLCGPTRFRTIAARGVLHGDQVISISIETLGAVDVWIDRFDVLFGYRTRRDIPPVGNAD